MGEARRTQTQLEQPASGSSNCPVFRGADVNAGVGSDSLKPASQKSQPSPPPRLHAHVCQQTSRETGSSAPIASTASLTHQSGQGVRLLDENLIAVRIPRFQSQGTFGSHVGFTILLEQPGSTQSIIKRYSEFQQLHEDLSRRPFASSLPPLPPHRTFANFDSSFLERRRQQLEAYLSFLCLHSLVLLDETLWRWFSLTGLTQVAVGLCVAQTLRLPTHVASRMEDIMILLARGENPASCLHPNVMETLREVLGDPHAKQSLQCSACCVLEHLLLHRRARQLFLPRAVGGISLLLSVYRRGGDLEQAAQRVFEAICDIDDTLDGKDCSRRLKAESTPGDTELGECCVCLDRGKSHAFLPCGHLCACMDCAAFLSARRDKCPICRRKIDRSVQIFV